ncbi:cytochrome P450 [Neohortaea acidophila]|uniref:Cytochrome P450 n=1 Tax=Neohortaea acidophila TaxID=245834 RepID=A0A6A6PQ52_9PEZI|nr:cytochrome P450 [Neohortaea acidophila]KAF2481801.1 cytochrome P450 [Neohortaea acidophila]
MENSALPPLPPIARGFLYSAWSGLHSVQADWLPSRTAIPLILLSLLACTLILQAYTHHRHNLALASHFQAFAASTNSSPTTPAPIPYTLLTSARNKLALLRNLKRNLLSTNLAQKFHSHGPTHAIYNPYGLPKVVHTIDPRNVHAVLSAQSQDYGVPAARLAAIGPIGSRGVVMTEGAVWHANRKAINAGFRGARFTDGIEENTRTLFSTLTEDGEGWTAPVPLFDAFAFMSLDRSIRHMFGVRADLQAKEGAAMRERLRWKEAFDVVARYVSVRSVLGRKSWMYDGVPFRRACALLRRLCEGTIRAAVRESKAGNADAVTGCFVGNLVQETADVRRVCDVTLDVFIAGHNMTSGVLSWLFFELEKRPDVYEAVRREVLDTFGTASQPRAEMTWDRLQQCQLLSNCINETMRLYPTLPNIGRQTIRDTVLPTGGGEDGQQPLALPKGTVVMCCLYLMHRRPEEWGADTEEFRPERWVGLKPSHSFSPFGGGPRICPGKLFGLVELFHVTARIMQRFQAIRKPEGEAPVRVTGAGVLLPPDGARLQLQVAEG